MSRCAKRGASGREPQHLMLTRPRDRRVEQAGDADPVWQPTFDGGFDEVEAFVVISVRAPPTEANWHGPRLITARTQTA